MLLSKIFKSMISLPKKHLQKQIFVMILCHDICDKSDNFSEQL